MPRYALILNNVFSRLEIFSSQPADIPHKGVQWKPCPIIIPPTYDPAAERITGPTYVINTSDVTEVWTKSALTAQEISTLKDSAVENLNGAIFMPLLKILFNLNNRVRALEGQTAMTIPQFKAAIKALL